jgi:cytochrome P450
LPLEADPPRHTQLRLSVAPIAPKEPQFFELAARLIKSINRTGTAEIGRDLALPYVMVCLGIIYNRQQDVDEWISWGPNVWLAEVFAVGGVKSRPKPSAPAANATTVSRRSGRLRLWTATCCGSSTKRNSTQIMTFKLRTFGTSSLRLRLTARGFRGKNSSGWGSVILAGWRDTVIKLINGFVWHLIRNEEDRDFLAQHPDRRIDAIREMARYLSPLPKMERLVKGRPR